MTIEDNELETLFGSLADDLEITPDQKVPDRDETPTKEGETGGNEPDRELSADPFPDGDNTPLDDETDENDTSVEVYKELYGEDITPDDEPSDTDTFVSSVEKASGLLTTSSDDLRTRIDSVNARAAEIPDYVASYKGKSLDALSPSELSAFQQDSFNEHGEEVLDEIQTALRIVEESRAINAEVEQLNGSIESHQWDRAFYDLVKRKPEVYGMRDDIRKELDKLAPKVEYAPHDLDLKRRLLQSAIKNVVLRKSPAAKSKQTPEADVKKTAATASKPRSTPHSVDEAADQVMRGEASVFDYL